MPRGVPFLEIKLAPSSSINLTIKTNNQWSLPLSASEYSKRMDAHYRLSDNMELEVETDGVSVDSALETFNDIETGAFENERCGICMDIIIDRGVIDCCQDWFCFSCIDNWATITNLCPLCQNEFQLITCVPVYDTIGSAKVDDDSISRHDDWFIQGKNNTLSFPSYYIDENAVICLDEDCKIRNGTATLEDDPNLDTSIACDSCDKWYHAFCVGFDPESTLENSWLCPRCVIEEASQNSGVSIKVPSTQIDPEAASQECTIVDALSRKLSVSIADAGETAVVISLIEGKHRVQEATENVPLAVDYRDKKTLDRKNDIQPNVNLNETSLASSSWKDSHITLSKDNSLLHSELKTNSYENDPADLLSNIPNIESEPSEYESNVDPHLALYVGPSLSVDRSSSIETENHNSDGSKISADVLSNIHNIETDLSEKEANTDPQLGFFMGSSLSVDKSNTETENHNSRVSQMHYPSKELSLSVEKMMTEAIEDTAGFSSVKRKFRKSRGRTLTTEDTKHVNGYASHKMVVEVTAKKVKVHTESEQPPLTLGTRNSLSRGISKHKCLPDDSRKLNDIQEKEDETSDIMNIVVRDHALTTEDTKHDHSYASHKMVVEVPAEKAKVHRESEQPHSNHGTRNSSSRGISKHKCLPDDSSKLNDVQEKEDETSDFMNIVVRDHALTTEDTKHDHSYASHKMVVEVPAKKAKVHRESEQPHSNHGTRNSSSRGISKHKCLPDDSSKLNDVQEKEKGTSDIMNIVRGIDHRPSHVAFSNNGNGLRVKKIMRRAVENESSGIVEKLRKEIREAVRNKAAKNFGKDEPFNPKLLIAFRAAIAGPRAEQEPVKKLNPSVLRSKKSMLQKGKIRENLTKKIYATNNGRRRRAWDRDWEIEFWKRRCVRASKAEKIDTLKSVLDLLNKSSDMDQELEADRANPILSRLYLADTSLFPRKDDVKPLSALTSTGNDAVNKEDNLKGKVSTPINDDTNVCPATQTTETSSRASFIASTNIQLNRSTIKKTSIPSGSNMVVQQQKEMPDKSEVKSDKRKWALEVLARKTAAVGQATHGKQEDTSLPKEKYPLLAQLPPDMRPTVAPSPHNKVPISVRQAQLCRLTEHFLRKTNLPVIRRTADTELAVVDAINIEKEVADRSNGKIVYLNLCSQVLSQHMNNNRPDSTAESNPSFGFPAESTELEVNTLSSNLSAEEALKMAGLVSDSPPSSPLVEALNVEDDPSKSSREDTPDNVFDMDTHGDVDIYGDFEYDLEDESYIGGNVLKVKSPPEEGDLRMKLVFSTIKTDKTDNVPNLEDEERLGIVKAPIDTPCLELHKGGGIECSTFNDGTNTSSLKHDPLQGKTDEEQHLAECEELYGPNKEEITVMYPDEASVLPNSLIGRDAPAETLASVEHGCYMPDKEAGSTLEESCTESISAKSRLPADHHSFGRENSPNHSLNENSRKDKRPSKLKQSDTRCSVFEKVEAYIKEHIRPLCKSGVITVDQYRWAVGKTSEKIMRYHSKDMNANFLIKEGDKVKKLAEQYVEAAQQMP